jgi:hypothetical protein
MKTTLINRFQVNGLKVKSDVRTYIDGTIYELEMEDRDGNTATYYEDGIYTGIYGGSQYFEEYLTIDGEIPNLFDLFTQEEIVKYFPLTSDFYSKDDEKINRQSYNDWDSTNLHAFKV